MQSFRRKTSHGDTAATDDEAVPAPLGDSGEASRLGNGFEAGAAPEGGVADGRHRGGDGYGGEPGAVTEGPVADGRHRGGDGGGW